LNALENKVIVVTGGAGLLGREFIKSISEKGGIAIIADIDIESSKRYFSENIDSSKIDFVKLDITSKSSIKKAIDCIDNKYKKVDALVNNAYPKNKNYGNHFFDVEYNDFCENINLHMGGYFLTSQQFSVYFKKQGYGNIINISSIYGVIAPKFDIYDQTNMTMPVEYAAIKSSIIHLTKYMANYFKGLNIRVNTLSPGGILNNQPKEFLSKYNSKCLSKGMLNVEDLSGTLVFLLSDSSKYINGQNIIVDDGFSI
jgi:NAD(P)-dependent dehydrogenase (short-subunit alcohol dehydrogenase family)